MNFKFSTQFLAIIFLSLITQSCQMKIHSGTLITDEQIKSVAIKKTSKNEVEEKFGYPNVIPDYSKNTWYYIHRAMTKRAFFWPQIQSQRVVKLVFAGEQLASIEAIDNSHDAEIKIVDEYIRTKGSEKNPFQEYIGNIGKFHKGKKREQRR
ncbi:MAG: outer membrane protein assembly factor BamE [Rickettsiaceae bacterium]|nr:outer membrane protein assembly factor BamE [Rickettsiaceae bacterium]